MAHAVLTAPQFITEEAAFAYVEARLWPNGPICPHCGETGRIGRLNGKTTRIGLRKCYACKKPFTVRMGTEQRRVQVEGGGRYAAGPHAPFRSYRECSAPRCNRRRTG